MKTLRWSYHVLKNRFNGQALFLVCFTEPDSSRKHVGLPAGLREAEEAPAVIEVACDEAQVSPGQECLVLCKKHLKCSDCICTRASSFHQPANWSVTAVLQ